MPAIADQQLLEREAELEALRSLLDDAASGRGRLVLVEGAAGRGKSTLVATAGELARGGGLRVLTASGSELERDFAFGAMRQLFEPLLAASSPPERERLLAGAAAPAAWAIDAAGDGSARGGAGFAALHGLYWLTANVAADGPVVIAVDDLHWVDESSIRALDYLARRIADLPVAMVATRRPDEPGSPAALLDGLAAQPAVTTVAPRALSAAAVGELVRRSRPAADRELCASFYEASAGNPLYVGELIRTFAGNDEISPVAVREASVPALGERLMRRIERVGPGGRQLASAMAVLGGGERLATAATLAGLEEPDAARVAQRLVRIEVLAGEDPFSFVHPLVRRSVYDSLSVTERDAAHEAAVQVLESLGAAPEALAAHLGATRPSGSERVASAMRAAAAEAMGRAAPDAAIRALRRALAEAAPMPRRTELLFELGQAELLVRDPACLAHLSEAHELEDDPSARADIALVLIELLVAAGQWEAGAALIERTMRDRAALDQDRVTAVAAFHTALCAYDSRLVERFDRDREWIDVLAAAGTPAARTLRAMLAAVTSLRGGPPEHVVGLVERALGDDGLVPDRSDGTWATAQAIGGLQCMEEYELADELSARLEAHGRHTGSLYAVVSGVAFRGIASCRRGDLVAAEADLRTVTDLIAQSGMSMWMSHAFHAFADAILERPSLDDVASSLDGIEVEPAFLGTFAGAMLLEARGRRRLLAGDRAAALGDLRAAASVNSALGWSPTHSAWRSTLALALPAGERDEARELIDDELELARATGLARPYGIALRAAGMVTGGEEGLTLLRDSVIELERSEARCETARSRVELGAALRRANRRGDARSELAAGMDLAYRCGAVRLVERAYEELRATGARPRRASRSGVDALTASELRVARLAAHGHSNLEIAQQLYVSTKTVDSHLSRAYGKLGLSGQGARRQLPAALDEPPGGGRRGG